MPFLMFRKKKVVSHIPSILKHLNAGLQVRGIEGRVAVRNFREL